MESLLEVRWHGRGGQGAKTAALLLAESASDAGKFIQAFPEYGPERMGAPVQAFTRIADEPITMHCHVTNPKIVVVLEPNLIGQSTLQQSTEDGVYVINTDATPQEMKPSGIKAGKVFTVDAIKVPWRPSASPFPTPPCWVL